MHARNLPLWLLGLLAVSLAGCGGATNASSSGESSGARSAKSPVALLNVSYDPTREFYQEFNASFAAYWKEKSGQDVSIEQSHGGSGKQARAVIDGMKADVVTLALAYDIDAIADKAQLLPKNWQQRLPHNSSPYTSTIVFLVRKGNPKNIKDWGDLIKGDVEIVTPNPKTSGGARWNYLAAWGYALKRELGDLSKLKDPAAKAEVELAQAKARAFVAEIYKRVSRLDTGARASTNTFVQLRQGDVLLAWENEAFLSVKEAKSSDFEIVAPSISILAEPPVAVVDKVAQKNGTTEVAKAYLEHLYSPQGQQLAARHFYRPAIAESISAEQRNQFATLELFNIDDVFGGWARAQHEHFDDGGIFDQIQQGK
ncbi:MAG TPA: sulfate ABC transporter substrate-binding protein [Pirellulaceae bacterium]|nr:sulfate ABC transporter substrate-binding protein [Pirellulaceae bacterium]